MFGERPAAGLMTFAIEMAQESHNHVPDLGIFGTDLVSQDS